MRAFVAFLKKEWLESIRSGKLILILILFCCFGIMNPAIAKLTPWLMDIMSEELAESGMTVTAVKVDALTSWTQFFKNIPMALIAFVIVFSSAFTKEYASGTLTLMLTKGLARYKVLIAKTLVLISLWSGGYYLCYGVTYLYNAYFWDNSVAQALGISVLLWWLLGVWVICALIMLSAVCNASSTVLVGVGATVLAAYLFSFIPRVGEYSPAMLMNSSGIIFGANETGDFTVCGTITAFLCVIFIAASVPIMNKKRL